ncbi:MAG: hypothetical protein EOP48_09015 [Sphingobacteriales bacterium]|nr:MAG: hypothetical protein EOP48_09015 [Sphingobacteriales bacterium]
MSRQDILRFQRSITKELGAIKDRVRDIIGPANWGEDGRFKEAILRKTIKQFLPSNLNIGTGFIVKKDHLFDSRQSVVSSQLDIIVYDEKSPVIFREGDFVILTESAVRAVVEVKTKAVNYSSDSDNSLNRIIEKFNRLRTFESFNPLRGEKKKFVGLFCFEYDGNFESSRIDEAFQLSNGLVNHVSLGPNFFVRYWESTVGLMPPVDYDGRCYIRYNIDSLSFSYFISNLLHIVSDEDPIERYWFSFPIRGTKELYRVGDVIELA